MVNNNELKSQLFHILEKEDAKREIEVLRISDFVITDSKNRKQSYWETWYDVNLFVSASVYSTLLNEIQLIEKNILACIHILYRSENSFSFNQVCILPKNEIELTEKQKMDLGISTLIPLLEKQKAIMIAVSTGGPRIQEKNTEYQNIQKEIVSRLKLVGLEHQNMYSDLWEWYGFWNSNLRSYQERREYIGKLFDPFIASLRDNNSFSKEGVIKVIEYTGWERIDRTADKIKQSYLNAKNEEEFQTIGLLCRENLISLSNEIYDERKHLEFCDTPPSPSDSKRKIDAYIQFNLSGKSNENIRKFAKVAIDLANEVTHKRTASKKDAGLSITATSAIINIIRLIENKENLA